MGQAMGTDSYSQKIDPVQKMSRARHYFRFFFIAAVVIILAFWMDYWFRGEIGIAKKFKDFVGDQWGTGILIGGGIFYVLLLSLPFVPGVELGVLLMCVFGKEGIVFVYFATVTGLSLAFLMGRLLPLQWLKTRLKKLGLASATERRFDEIDSMLANLSLSQNLGKNRLLSYLVKYRYPAIGILFNMPGNYLIGGGGGISFACGISRNVSWKWFLLTTAVAVSPVPLMAWFGVIQLETFFRP